MMVRPTWAHQKNFSSKWAKKFSGGKSDGWRTKMPMCKLHMSFSTCCVCVCVCVCVCFFFFLILVLISFWFLFTLFSFSFFFKIFFLFAFLGFSTLVKCFFCSHSSFFFLRRDFYFLINLGDCICRVTVFEPSPLQWICRE